MDTAKHHSTGGLGKPPQPCRPRDKLYFKLFLPLCRHLNQPISRAKLLISSSPNGRGDFKSRSCGGGWACSPHGSAPLSSGHTDMHSAGQKINIKESPMPKPPFQPEHCWEDQSGTWSVITSVKNCFPQSMNFSKPCMYICLAGIILIISQEADESILK